MIRNRGRQRNTISQIVEGLDDKR